MYRYKQKFTNTYVDRHVKQIKVHQHIYSVRPLLAQECWANVSGLGVVLVSLANYVQPWVTRVDSAAIHGVVLVRCGRDRDESLVGYGRRGVFRRRLSQAFGQRFPGWNRTGSLTWTDPGSSWMI